MQDFMKSVQQHLPFLRAQAHKWLHNTPDVDDLLQDTLFMAWKAWPRYEDSPDQPKLRAWLYRILFNNFANSHRRRSRTLKRFKQLTVDIDLPAPEPMDQQLGDEHLRLLNSLGDKYRRVLELRASGLSHQDIADTLGIPLGTSLSRLSRAAQLMRTKIWSRDHALSKLPEEAECQDHGVLSAKGPGM